MIPIWLVLSAAYGPRTILASLYYCTCSTISSAATNTTSSEKHTAHPYSPTPSADIVVARLMELEPEKDRWRRVARERYAKVIAEFPGYGKSHHHLGLLSREAEGDELRAVCHFIKR
jgi:hypothetical protein